MTYCQVILPRLFSTKFKKVFTRTRISSTTLFCLNLEVCWVGSPLQFEPQTLRNEQVTHFMQKKSDPQVTHLSDPRAQSQNVSTKVTHSSGSLFLLQKPKPNGTGRMLCLFVFLFCLEASGFYFCCLLFVAVWFYGLALLVIVCFKTSHPLKQKLDKWGPSGEVRLSRTKRGFVATSTPLQTKRTRFHVQSQLLETTLPVEVSCALLTRCLPMPSQDPPCDPSRHCLYQDTQGGELHL